jgi:hypothetical protein
MVNGVGERFADGGFGAVSGFETEEFLMRYDG